MYKNSIVFSLLLVWLAAGTAMAGYMPRYARTQMFLFPADSIAVESKKTITVDGDLSDWNPKAFVFLYPSKEHETNFAVRLALAYKDTGLLIAARFTDKTPMMNLNKTPDMGWNADCLQLRFVGSSKLQKPLPVEEVNGGHLSHCTLYYDTEKQQAVRDICYGLNFHGRQTVYGPESGLVFVKGPEGSNEYTMEGLIPWAALNAAGPEPGSNWLFTLQVIFSNQAGVGYDFEFSECVVRGGNQYEGVEGWGTVYFVKPDEVQARLVQQDELAAKRVEKEKAGYAGEIEEVSRKICEKIDWSRPELKGTEFEKAYLASNCTAAATGFIHHLRARKRPVLEYSKKDIAQIRAKATAGDIQRERETWAKNKGGMVETYALGATQEDFWAQSRSIMDKQPSWGTGRWGATRSATRELSKAWPLEEYPDEALIPMLGWLIEEASGEWVADRAWTESLLGCHGHNWWAVSYRGFFQAGLYFPEFKGFAQWRAFAPSWIEYEADRLFASDGYSRERSGYHGMWNDLAAAYKVALLNDIKFRPDFKERMRVIAEATSKTMTPSGDTPAFGDGYPPYRTLKLADPKVLREAAALNNNQTETCLPETGYYVMRENWTPHADYLAIDAGARGNGVTSHDMSEVFHFQLHAKGQCILGNQGAGAYDGSPERMWRRGDFSHNCPTVDGLPSVTPVGNHGFGAVIMPSVEAFDSKPAYAYFSAVHEGYRFRTNGVSAVRRKIFYLRGNYWILIDRFTAMGTSDPHTYQQNFQLPVPAILGTNGKVVTRGEAEGGNLVMAPVPGLTGDARLQVSPLPQGAFNPDNLTFTKKTLGNGVMAMVMVPFEGSKAPEVEVKLLDVEADGRIVSPFEITGLEITVNGKKDVYVDQHMHWTLPWQAGGYSGERRLFHSRCIKEIP